MDINSYRAKLAEERVGKNKEDEKAIIEKRFEVFGIHEDGYFNREPLCDGHHHLTILEAAVCANIRSLGTDIERYGVEVEIVMLSGSSDFYRQKDMEVITKEKVERTLERATAQKAPMYRAMNAYGSCLHRHGLVTEAAICADAYEIGRGYAPCGACSKEIGAAIYSQTPCFKHRQIAGVEELNGRQLAPQEIYFGMQLETLQGKVETLPEPEIKPAEVQPDIQPDERRQRRKERRAS